MLDALYRLGRTPQFEILGSDASTSVFRSREELSASYWMQRPGIPMIWNVSGTTPTESFEYRLNVLPHDQLERAQQPLLESLRVGDGSVDLRNSSSQERFSTALRAFANSSDEALARVAAALQTTLPFSFVPSAMRAPAPLQDGTALEPDGRNLAGAVDSLLTGGNRSAVNEVEDALRRNIPSLDGYALRSTTLKDIEERQTPFGPLANPYAVTSTPYYRERAGKALEFVMKRGGSARVQIPATQVSDARCS